jgi:hypothetical protein
MDPSPNDPGTLFLSPPFDNIPELEKYPTGLTYSVLAENPEWFLIPSDYIRFDVSDSSATIYPTELEPPRGWCPARKKDLQQRGGDSWPEGEEPRLRCTFCRRTYAGVNAKSMWRRHVYEKHKVAMENRVRPRGMTLDSAVRPRGRGANKENKLSSKTTFSSTSMEAILNMDIQPQLASSSSESKPHRSKFRHFSTNDIPETSIPDKGDLSPSRIDFGTDNIHPLSQSTLPALSPPPTPSRSRSRISTPSPSSPYDPLVTPSFRHSPARLTSDKPWRFSPGHPLYNRTREVMLTTLMPVAPSPWAGMKHPSTDDSPVVSAGKGKQRVLDPNTPDSFDRMKATPFRSLLRSKSFTPLTEKESVDMSSPINRKDLSQLHRKGLSSIGSIDDWLSDGTTVLSSRSPRVLLKGSDPFADVWTPVKGICLHGAAPSSSPMRAGMANCSPPLSLSGTESPVLRSSESSRVSTNPYKPSGLGIGLLEAFTLSRRGEDKDSDSYEDALMSPLVSDDSEEVEDGPRPSKTTRSPDDHPSPDDRPSKKRRRY